MSIQVCPYLRVNENGNEVIQLYQKALNAEILSHQSLGEMLENIHYAISHEDKDLVGYATLKIGDSILMLSDTDPRQP
ncbi:VOC family protein [Cytobacillus sp. Hm23]